MTMPMTHFDMKYGPRTGTDEENEHIEKIKGELAKILEAPRSPVMLTGDDRKWLLMCIASLRPELHAWCKAG
jgi:hypothetical protein